MKTKTIVKELLLWLIIALPLAYYFYNKHALPQQVAIHFNALGEPDRWIDKGRLLWFVLGLPLGVYLLMLIIPLIDPKRKLSLMGNKFYMLRLLMTVIMAAVVLFVLLVAVEGNNLNTQRLIALLLSAIFILFGNYLPAVRPNYFIGIRTPWTLESEEIWRKTHRLAGWLWTAGGLIVLILGLLLPRTWFWVLVAIVVILAFIPVIYSFALYLRRRSTAEQDIASD